MQFNTIIAVTLITIGCIIIKLISDYLKKSKLIAEQAKKQLRREIFEEAMDTIFNSMSNNSKEEKIITEVVKSNKTKTKTKTKTK